MRRRVKTHLPEPSAASGPVKEITAEEEKNKKIQGMGIGIAILTVALVGLKMYLGNSEPKDTKNKKK